MSGGQKAQEREELEAQIRSFLDSGKKIDKIPSGTTGNPTCKGIPGLVITPRTHICSTNPNKNDQSNPWDHPHIRTINQK